MADITVGMVMAGIESRKAALSKYKAKLSAVNKKRQKLMNQIEDTRINSRDEGLLKHRDKLHLLDERKYKLLRTTNGLRTEIYKLHVLLNINNDI
jgi:hypothetical protein